jgi:hypothetical protein
MEKNNPKIWQHCRDKVFCRCQLTLLLRYHLSVFFSVDVPDAADLCANHDSGIARTTLPLLETSSGIFHNIRKIINFFLVPGRPESVLAVQQHHLRAAGQSREARERLVLLGFL